MLFRLARATRRRGCRRARAGAVVEFAVILPLLVTFLFGIIEYGWLFMVRQTMQNAAREGCRIAVLQTSFEPYTAVYDRITQVMDSAGIDGYTVEMTHADDVSTCDEVVTLTIDYADVSLLGGFFGSHPDQLAGNCTMRKEGCAVDED